MSEQPIKKWEHRPETQTWVALLGNGTSVGTIVQGRSLYRALFIVGDTSRHFPIKGRLTALVEAKAWMQAQTVAYLAQKAAEQAPAEQAPAEPRTMADWMAKAAAPYTDPSATAAALHDAQTKPHPADVLRRMRHMLSVAKSPEGRFGVNRSRPEVVELIEAELKSYIAENKLNEALNYAVALKRSHFASDEILNNVQEAFPVLGVGYFNMHTFAGHLGRDYEAEVRA